MGLGLWGALQSAAIAYGRANYGEGIPASRYMDMLNVFVIASLFAMVLLARFWMRGEISRKFALLLPLFFAAVIFFGLCRNSQMVVEGLLIPTRMMNLIAEERVETFMATGERTRFLNDPPCIPIRNWPWSIAQRKIAVHSASRVPATQVPTGHRPLYANFAMAAAKFHPFCIAGWHSSPVSLVTA